MPGLWIGRRLNNRAARGAVAQGVTAVLDLTAEFSESKSFLAQRYLNIPVLDLTAPTQKQLRWAIEFIAGEIQRGVVYVHCKIGYSRSAAVVGAYLVHTGRAATATRQSRCCAPVRPSIVVRPEARRAIVDFCAAGRESGGAAISPVERRRKSLLNQPCRQASLRASRGFFDALPLRPSGRVIAHGEVNAHKTLACPGCVAARREAYPLRGEAVCLDVQAKTLRITRPSTFVSRRRMPLCSKVSCSWSSPSRCRIVALKS